jgi:hypothetical protein
MTQLTETSRVFYSSAYPKISFCMVCKRHFTGDRCGELCQSIEIEICQQKARHLEGLFYCAVCQRFQEDLCETVREGSDLIGQGI